MKNAIEISHLSKFYGDAAAVDDLSLTVKSGTVYGLLGENGAGKSTTIECILGTRRADAGRVVMLGSEMFANLDGKQGSARRISDRERRRLFSQVGVQFQECDYQPEIRVSELCEETACLYDEPADWRKLCDRFGIGDKINNQVKSLSGGERQRLFIVLALIPNPKMVFLDELTTGLDARARRQVWQILEELKKTGITILLTSHFMDEVEALCDEICILRKGRIRYMGTVAGAREATGCTDFEEAYLALSGEEE